jgi:hypothetical protein
VASRITRRRFLTGAAATSATLLFALPALANRGGRGWRRFTPPVQNSQDLSDPPPADSEPVEDASSSSNVSESIPSEWETVATTSDTLFLDEGLTPGATYEYRIASATSDWQSDWSPVHSATVNGGA